MHKRNPFTVCLRNPEELIGRRLQIGVLRRCCRAKHLIDKRLTDESRRHPISSSD